MAALTGVDGMPLSFRSMSIAGAGQLTVTLPGAAPNVAAGEREHLW